MTTQVKVLSLAEMKARIKNRNAEKSNFKSTVDKNFYPFWEMAAGGDGVTVRILPDTNPDNPYMFYVERDSHKLTIDGKDYNITCPKTFGRTNECPICLRSQHYYNNENNAAMGKRYWRKRAALVRLLILDGNIPTLVDEDQNPIDYNGRVCNSQFGTQIIQTIDDQIADFDDTDPNPVGIDDGFDFIIKKVTSGKFSDYGFSKFARHPSPIDPKYANDLDLIDLSTLLPEQPTLEQVQHFLDAHDGAVEYNGGKPKAEEEAPKPQAVPDAEKPAPVTASGRTEAETKTRASAVKEDAPASVATLSSDGNSAEDKALIDDIINRHQ